MGGKFVQKESFEINSTQDDIIETITSFAEVIIPDIKPQKVNSLKPVIVIIEDDFSTLDLMKIYLQRNYECIVFDGPRDAIFYLNRNIPDLIFMDCYIRMIDSKRVLEIIRSYKELADVPIVYIAEAAEKGAILSKMHTGIIDCITRPVARGELQTILDRVFSKVEKK